MLKWRMRHLPEEVVNGCEHGLSNPVWWVVQRSRAQSGKYNALELPGTGKCETWLHSYFQVFQQSIFHMGLQILLNESKNYVGDWLVVS